MSLSSWTDVAPEPPNAVASDEADVPDELVYGVRGQTKLRQDCAQLLRQAGLRPTRQRLVLGWLLFAKGGRHLTAEMLHAEAADANIHISLATVYNTLHQFTEAGLLRQVIVDAARSYFDTNTGDHQHFFLEKEGLLIDIPGESIAVATSCLSIKSKEICGVQARGANPLAFISPSISLR